MTRPETEREGTPRDGTPAGSPGVVLRCRARALPGAERRERVLPLPGSVHPRRLVAQLARSAELGIADAACDQAFVDGLDGLWAELLLLAWSHDQAVGMNRVAEALLTLDDARLAQLRDRVGPFDRGLALRVARVLLRAEGDPAVDGLSLAGLLAWASPGDGLDLDALEARLAAA